MYVYPGPCTYSYGRTIRYHTTRSHTAVYVRSSLTSAWKSRSVGHEIRVTGAHHDHFRSARGLRGHCQPLACDRTCCDTGTFGRCQLCSRWVDLGERCGSSTRSTSSFCSRSNRRTSCNTGDKRDNSGICLQKKNNSENDDAVRG